jgi:DNA-binding MarR family transcriptional regulator
MEKQGLVKRVKDLARKNRVRVVLTAKGRRLYNQTRRLDSIRSIVSSLSDEERQQLELCLRTLVKRGLEEIGTPYAPISPT